MTDAVDGSEELEFKVTLSGTYWKQPPEFAILIDGTVVHEDSIQTTSSKIGLPDEESMDDLDRVNSYHDITFKHTITPGDHTLGVRFKHKDLATDTLVDDAGNIVQDLLLTVEKVRVDGVDLGILIFDESQCDFDVEQTHKGETTKKLEKNVTLGYPGTWTLRFTSPFYLWLLERI